MLKIGVLVSGGGTNLQAIIDAIERGALAAEIVAVISSNPKAYAIERAIKHNIPFAVYRKKNFPNSGDYENALVAFLNEKGTELVITAGFMVLLDNCFVNAFRNRMLNIHPALIPAFCGKGYYGLKVHEAVLEKGVKITGATVHIVTEETDAGPIVLQKAVEVLDDDTPETLQRRVMEQAEWVILPQAIQMFAECKIMIDGNRTRSV